MDEHLLSKGPLLDKEGNLVEAGYAFSLVKTYNPENIKISKLRLKEWDYYYIGNDKFGLAMTIADNRYMDYCSVSLLDFETGKYIEDTNMGAFSMGRRNLPKDSSSGLTEYSSKGVHMSFEAKDGVRRLLCDWECFSKKKENLHIDITLNESMNGSSMVIATPWKKKGHFYYNQKINCQLAFGRCTLGDRSFSFDGSLAVLDWGRGTWTYINTWLWSSLNAKIGDKPFGWNLGYGFGDNDKATENMLFYDGKAIKMGEVSFDIPQDKKGRDDFLSPWKFSSKNGELEATFVPILDRHADTNVLLIRSNAHQVFGRFSGKAKINGKEMEFHDLLGFAEKVYNRW